MERFHLKFCKRVLRVHSKATNLAIYSELGRQPLIVRISETIIKYWLRVTNRVYENTLVGQAARTCLVSNTDGVRFANFLLKFCSLGALKDISLPLDKLKIMASRKTEQCFPFFLEREGSSVNRETPFLRRGQE